MFRKSHSQRPNILANWAQESLDSILSCMKFDEALKVDNSKEVEYEKHHLWLHDCTRNEAVRKLKKAHPGTYLIRPNKATEGDYVLSVCDKNKEIKHYIIHLQYPSINTFGLKSGDTRIHGLEEWVKHYSASETPELGVKLGEFCKKGSSPPHEVRKTGYTNLLHRAAQEGKLEVVKKYVANSRMDVNGKNSNGSTALHDACRNGHQEIVQWLIAHRADLSARDIHGYTPLQVACVENRPVIVRLLILEGDADPDERNFLNHKRVALHEAASRNHIGCVKLLFVLDATVWIMDDTSKTGTSPHDLAKGYKEIEGLMDNHTPLPAGVNKEDWYHKGTDKHKLESVLKKHTLNNGTFLVRDSTRMPGTYVLCLIFNKDIKHFAIKNQGEQLYYLEADNDRFVAFLPSLEHLIKYYSQRADCIPCTLKHAVKPGGGTVKMNIPPIKKRCDTAALKKLQDPPKGAMPTSRKKTAVNYSLVKKDFNKQPFMIPREHVMLSYEIGQGEFGSVYKGKWETRSGGQDVTVDVAIKTLNDDVSSGRESFLQEAKIMKDLDHACIVKLIGICEGPPFMLIQELMPLGSMLDYLLDYPEKIDVNVELSLWASQIAEGMMYLESQRFVHRDLAARNIMLENNRQVKVGDFGLSRAVGSGSEYYKASAGGRWPVKWYAPEAVLYGHFSSASDVWSYGVTLWEMYTFGDQPYDTMTGSQVLEMIERGERLQQPDGCPDHIYNIMMDCWQHKKEARPTFDGLKEKFATDPVYASTRELVRQESRC